MFQLKSDPSEKEEREAQNQLRKSDEIQRLLAQAHHSYDSRDCGTAVALLDTVIEVKPRTELLFPQMLSALPSLCRLTSFLPFTDLRLGRGLSRDESRVLH